MEMLERTDFTMRSPICSTYTFKFRVTNTSLRRSHRHRMLEASV